MVARRADDFCSAGESHTPLEPRHAPFRCSGNRVGSLDFTARYNGLNNGYNFSSHGSQLEP